jgi:hypothetical protein
MRTIRGSTSTLKPAPKSKFRFLEPASELIAEPVPVDGNFVL